MRYQTLYGKWDSAILIMSIIVKGFPRDTSGKEYSGQCRKHKRCWLNHWIRKILEGGHGNLLQSSGLKNLMNSGAWWVTVHWVANSWTGLKRLSMLDRLS